VSRAKRLQRSPIRLLVLAWAIASLVWAIGLTACGAPEPVGKRVLVIGFDGMDYELTRRLLDEGRLPNLERLATTGGFASLQTSIPPQSPVAWSEFITGLDAGGHGIFDFVHRDPATMVPYFSTSTTQAPGRSLELGRWRLPLGAGTVELMRHGTPFWEVLEERGVRTTIMRVPANFPPSGSASRELSGMGTPDLLGGYGTFFFFTSAPETAPRQAEPSGGGQVFPVEVQGGIVRGVLRGPPNPLLAEPEDLEADFTVYIDPVRPVAKIVLGSREMILQEGEWSDWAEVEFTLPFFQKLRGACRFYLKAVRPDFELYVTPLNIDPLDPAMPISTPSDFAGELARAGGRFYTQGMPEDTKALTGGVFDNAEFLAQAALVADEQRRQYRFLLDGFEDGLFFYYFGFLDQVSHVMWRAMDPEHPAHDPERDAPYRHAIEDLYVKADAIVGETLERLAGSGDDVTLIVMSDHGFTSWRRAFSLNAWLEKQGYLAVRDAQKREVDFLQNVDWSRTQAYGLGLSGLYINREGRESVGIVSSSEARWLEEEIIRGLLRAVDPKTGELAIAAVHRRDEVYADSGYLELGPDLVVEYSKGVRSSDDSAAGRVPAEVFSDNTSEWSGDHIMDHEAVPGVLLSNRPLRRPARSLRDMGASLLAEFGIEGFPPPAVEQGERRE
jgi:predicted AlkP superfamily phosphohydrolase/phosphomutase